MSAVEAPEIRLIDQVSAAKWGALEVECYLMSLVRTSADRLPEVLRKRNAKGMHIFQWAVQSADIPLLKILLSFDILSFFRRELDEISTYAKMLCLDAYSGEESRRARLKVCALINSRIRWDALTSRGEIPFSKSMRAIKEAFKNINELSLHRAALLMFGATGEGKSTFVNYQLGVDYNIRIKNGLMHAVKKNPSDIEFALTGDGPLSLTRYPQAFNDKINPFVYVDMPGFQDTRGTPENLAAAAATCMLPFRLDYIHSLCMVVSWSALEDPRMLIYRATAESVGEMISAHSDIQQNLILIITKPSADLSVADVKARLESLAELENFSALRALKIATEAILKRAETHIVIADIRSPAARAAMASAIRLCCPQPAKKYCFNQHLSQLQQFQTLCEFFQKERSDRVEKQTTLSARLNEAQIEEENIRLKIADWLKKIEELKKSQLPFDPTPYEQLTRESSEKARAIAEDLKRVITEKTRLDWECRTTQQKVFELELKCPELTSEQYESMVQRGKIPASVVKEIRKFENEPFLKGVLGRTDVEEKNRLRGAVLAFYSGKGTTILDAVGELKDARNKKEETSLASERARTLLWKIQDDGRAQEIALAKIGEDLRNAKAAHEISAKLAARTAYQLVIQKDAQDSELSVLLSEIKGIKQDQMMAQFELEVNEDLFSNLAKISFILKGPTSTVTPWYDARREGAELSFGASL